jgi:hypothetical protein
MTNIIMQTSMKAKEVVNSFKIPKGVMELIKKDKNEESQLDNADLGTDKALSEHPTPVSKKEDSPEVSV